MDIQKQLLELRDEEYKAFMVPLMPTVDSATIIGIRTPQLRALAKKVGKDPDVSRFLEELPHRWFEENQLHAFILSEMKEYDRLLEFLEQFLPYVDNWATCDQLRPKAFGKHREELLPVLCRWIGSDRTYTIRFGVGMLMVHYLDQDFRKECLQWVSKIQSEEYYVNMMLAWYFATALAKQWEAAIPYLEERKLTIWVHNKTIQKAVESRRITEEQKQYLRTLRIREKKQIADTGGETG